MSFKAKFKAAGLELNIISCDYSLHQDVDSTGRPSSITRGGTINLSVESTGDTALFEWMCNSFDHKDGTITFMKRDTDAKLKEIEFKEAYMVSFAESFNHEGSTPFLQSFTISAKELNIGGGSHKNDWV